MRHRNHSQRLSRKPDQARGILKNMVTSVILYERIRTTKKRAQVVRPLIDRVITLGKRERTDLAIRKINLMVSDINASRKILEVLTKRYANRPSGFTRIEPVGQRQGDGALLVDLMLIDSAAPETVEAPVEKPAKKKAPSAKKSA